MPAAQRRAGGIEEIGARGGLLVEPADILGRSPCSCRGETAKPSSRELDRRLRTARPRAACRSACARSRAAAARRARRPNGRRPPRRRSRAACRPAPRNSCGVAAAGAVSRASKVVTVPAAASYQARKAPPPRPEDCGSTRPSTVCTATSASAALPPARSTSSPASAASGLAATTICRLACTTGLRPIAARRLRRDGVGRLLGEGWARAESGSGTANATAL